MLNDPQFVQEVRRGGYVFSICWTKPLFRAQQAYVMRGFAARTMLQAVLIVRHRLFISLKLTFDLGDVGHLQILDQFEKHVCKTSGSVSAPNGDPQTSSSRGAFLMLKEEA